MAVKTNIEQITAKVSTLDGAGMDGGVGGISSLGGGEFKMRICANTAKLREGRGEGGGSEAEVSYVTLTLHSQETGPT